VGYHVTGKNRKNVKKGPWEKYKKKKSRKDFRELRTCSREKTVRNKSPKSVVSKRKNAGSKSEYWPKKSSEGGFGETKKRNGVSQGSKI